jgi:hypothetical protein
MMAKDKPEPPLDPTDPGPFPDFLKVENRVPLTPEQQAKLDAAKKTAIEQAYDPKRWDKPKSMSDEDYDAWKNRERLLDKQDKLKERFTQLKERKKKAPKAEAPKDTFRLLDWAREAGLVPSLVRGVARANKDRLKPLESLKYVYPNSVKEQVSKIIREGLAKKKAKQPVTKKVKRAPKAKPGSERKALKHMPPSAKKKRKR